MSPIPLVSIIIPVYKVENYINYCIRSVLNQTLHNIEIILIDDGSPDCCPKLCDEFTKHDNRVKVIHKKNGGLGLARNSGLDVATGKYITFVDSDDYIDNNTIEILFKLAEENNLDILRYNYNRFIKENAFFKKNVQDNLQIFTDFNDIRQIALCLFSISLNRKSKIKGLGGSVCTGLYKRELLENYHIRFHSERELLSEDFVFSYDCLQHTKRIGKIFKPLYHYRVNPHSLTTQVNLDKLDKAFDFCHYMTTCMKADGYSATDAELYPMGYYLDAIRTQVKLVFLSQIPMKSKKNWFERQAKKDYINEIKEKYPFEFLLIKHRLHFWIVYHKHFWIMYFLTHFSKLFNSIIK